MDKEKLPWVCVKCGYRVDKFESADCPECGGMMEVEEPKIDWEGEGPKSKKEK